MRGLSNNNKDVNQQAEMFSLGVLFFIIWVGDTTFKDKCLDLYVYNQNSKEIVFDGFPEDISFILNRLLKFNPEERASIQEIYKLTKEWDP